MDEERVREFRRTRIPADGAANASGKSAFEGQCDKDWLFAKMVLTAEPFREHKKDLATLLADLRGAIQVHDQFEEILIENLALQLFRLVRLYQTDANVAPRLFQTVREEIESGGEDAVIAGLIKGESASAAKFPGADLLIRYEANIWRQIDRIMERIQKWRQLRSELPAQPSHTLRLDDND